MSDVRLIAMPMELPDRILAKIEKVTESGCWIWTGSMYHDGYGQLHFEGRQYRAHRFIYEWYKVQIPEGRQIDHLCRVRPCVNPDHLEPVTQLENIFRGEGISAHNKIKTHCCKGHELSGENLRFKKFRNGSFHRLCRICVRAGKKLDRQRKKSSTPLAMPVEE